MISESIPAPTKEDHTFAELVQDREVEYPTLARAARDTSPVRSIRIEWLVDVLDDDGKLSRDIWHNFTQIVRTIDPDPDKARHQMLSAVEKTLIYGTPSGNPNEMYTMCGGYKHYLNRDLNDNDRLVLCPLREPLMWKHDWKFSPDHGWYALDTPIYEWLTEFSLQVSGIPAA